LTDQEIIFDPQNIEQGMMNVEGIEKLHNSKFLVQYSTFKENIIFRCLNKHAGF